MHHNRRPAAAAVVCCQQALRSVGAERARGLLTVATPAGWMRRHYSSVVMTTLQFLGAWCHHMLLKNSKAVSAQSRMRPHIL